MPEVKESDRRRIIQEVKNLNSSNVEVKIKSVKKNFRAGNLYIIDLITNSSNNSKNPEHLECYYYDCFYSDESKYCNSLDEFISWSGRRLNKKSSSLNFIKEFNSPRVVSGLIAILITLTIIFILISDLSHQQETINKQKGEKSESKITLIKVPDVLSNALTIILGFYFGSTVGTSNKKDPDNNK